MSQKNTHKFHPIFAVELDIIEFLEMLWDGKWLISVFVALATLLAFGLSQFVEAKYNISIPYAFNIYSTNTQQICGTDSICMDGKATKRCMDGKATKRLLTFFGNTWDKVEKKSELFHLTSSPLDVSEYKAQIERASAALTNDVYLEAKYEYSLIQTELKDILLSTETVAKNVLNSNRIIQSVDNGQSVVSFGSISIVKSSPKVLLILILAGVLGGIIGVFFVLVRKAIKKRKDQLAKA